MGIAVNAKGHLDRRLDTAHFEGRVVAVEPARRISFEYYGGDFRGTAEWTFDKVDETHTRVAFRWTVSPARLMRFWTLFIDVPSQHSSVMRKGFAGLAKYVASRRVLGSV